jgi:gamma-glutamyltranspeptidase/glutathione hydrolase
VVAASQPTAVEAGLEMLRRGGSAVDAVLAAAIALTVTEPVSNGLGSDAFALVWDGARLHGLNGSGRAPAALDQERVRAAGYRNAMPAKGWLTVTVPGAVAAWGELHDRFGKLPWGALFEPGIRHAESGFRVMPTVAAAWGATLSLYLGLRGREFAGWRALFAPRGRAPRSGETWASREMGATLRRLVESGAGDFYEGELAAKIARFAQDTGGPMTEADLAAHRSTWVSPVRARYRGYDVWEVPPNGQGIAALIGLHIFEGFEAGQARDAAEPMHRQIEAMKLGFADAFRYVADPDFERVPVGRLLGKGYAAERRGLIGERALEPRSGDPYAGGTVYLCAVDANGMMVSFIQSNYQGFGSGIVVPGTGISLHNRGQGFSMDTGHPNRLEPKKRPYHTIIPGFVTKDGEAVGPFGVMGGYMQPQGHMQMVLNTLDYAMNPQASLDAPRWQWVSGRRVQVESTMSGAVVKGLRSRGHVVEVLPVSGTFGRGQIIWRLPSGEYVAGSDRRADGYAGVE